MMADIAKMKFVRYVAALTSLLVATPCAAVTCSTAWWRCMDLANPSNGRPTVTGWNDIHMRNCLVVDCTQAFETWCKDAPPGVGFRRCSFKGNSTINVGGG